MIKDDAILTPCGAEWNRVLRLGRNAIPYVHKMAGKKGYGTEVLDYLDGDEAGSNLLQEDPGMNAYGYLRSEKVFHRILSEFLHSMQQENDRHRLHPVM